MKQNEMATRRYTAASTFCTISLNDIHNPSSSCCSLYSNSNGKAFPSEVAGIGGQMAYLDSLQTGRTLIGEGNIPIPCCKATCARVASANPVAYVGEYKATIFDILEILIGLAPEHFWLAYVGTRSKICDTSDSYVNFMAIPWDTLRQMRITRKERYIHTWHFMEGLHLIFCKGMQTCRNYVMQLQLSWIRGMSHSFPIKQKQSNLQYVIFCKSASSGVLANTQLPLFVSPFTTT
jgi:hypothetical protein